MSYLGGGATARSGVVINETTALGLSPVWAAVDLISGDIGTLPFHSYDRVTVNGRDGRRKARDHQLWRLLMQHTGEMTANIWLQRIVAQALLYGNGYSRIIPTDMTGGVRLQFMHAANTKVVKVGGVIAYDWQPEGGGLAQRLREDEVFHLQGLTLDCWGGKSLIDHARNTFGRYAAAERFADDFHSEDGVMSGWFQHPAKLSPEAQDRFLAQAEARHVPSAGGRRRRFGVLEEGMTWEAAGCNAKEAMMIEALEFGVNDVARCFGVPAYKLGDKTRIGFNGTEQERREYADTALVKWISRLQFEANWKLRTEAEKRADSPYVEAELKALLRADTKSRYETYNIGILTGIINRNEARACENLNPYEGGDDFLVPLNMATIKDNETKSENRNRDLVEAIQKVYLGVDVVLSADEAREILNQNHGANLPGGFVKPTSDPMPANDGRTCRDERHCEPKRTGGSIVAAPTDEMITRRLAIRDACGQRTDELAKLLTNRAETVARRSVKDNDTSEFWTWANDVDSERRQQYAEGLQPIASLLAAETGSDASQVRDHLSEKLRAIAGGHFIEACDCQPEELPARVSDCYLAIKTAVRAVVDQILTGD